MEKSTVIEILKTFSKGEIVKFGDFCSSPYHNKKSNVVKLYKAVRKFAPDYPASKITKERMWKDIFPGKKYNYGIMKNLIYDLNGLAMKFLELERHALKTFECDVNLLEEYKLKSLKNLFIKKLQESRNKLSKSEIDSSAYYYAYMLEYIELGFMDYDYLLKTKGTDYYTEINKSLSLFYFTSILFHNLNNAQISFNFNLYFDKDFHSMILKEYENSSFKNTHTDILYYAYMTNYGNGGKESYYNLKKLFFDNYKNYNKSVQYDFAAALLNYCSNNHTRGNKDYILDEFSYIKLLIEEKLYLGTSYGWIDQYLFMKSVMSACRVNEFHWAEKFIEEHKGELIESIREQYTNYAYVTLSLRRGKFEEALTYLSQCRNVDGRDKLNIRVFEFNAYYELGYYDELKALADTTSHFLRKDKIYSAEEQKSFRNYVTAITKLMDYKFNAGNKQKDASILAGVSGFVSENKMLNKNWLLSKIEELKSMK